MRAPGIVGFCLLLGAPCLPTRAGGLSAVVEPDIQSLLEDHNDWIYFFCNSLDTIIIITWFPLWVMRLLYTPTPELRPQGSLRAELSSAPRATPPPALGILGLTRFLSCVFCDFLPLLWRELLGWRGGVSRCSVPVF